MQLIDDIILDRAVDAPRTCGAARIAIVDGERFIDWKDLAESTRRAALVLLRAGVSRGDRVAVVAPNAIESIVAYLAVLRAGGVLVPIPGDARMPRLHAVLADCAPSVVVAPRPILAALEAERADAGVGAGPSAGAWKGLTLDERFGRPFGVPPEFGRRGSVPSVVARDAGAIDADVAAIIYTSGTTGEPKGVMLSHANLLNTTAVIAEYVGHAQASTPEVVSCAVPIAFSYGLLQSFSALRSGATLVLERSFAFPYDAMRRLERLRATVLIAVPTMIARMNATLARVDVDLSALRAVTNAAAGLPPAHALRLTELLPNVRLHLMYGQTECSRASTLEPRLARAYPDSVGRAIPNSEVFLVDPEGRRLPPGSEGELVVRGANVARGYWRRTRESIERFICAPSDHAPGFERCLRTGDRFRMDQSGLLYFLGREDEIFKCRGEKVAPAAIERVLAEIAGVVDAAVTGVEHEEDGTAIKAVIVVEDGASVDERAIRASCRDALEPALQPRFIEFRREIPRTANGKIVRQVLAGTGS